MPTPDDARKLLPSLLDRLIDREPVRPGAGGVISTRRLDELKRAVKRDLEWLLNCKRILPEQPASRKHLNRSILAYGLPDFTSSSLSNPHDRAALIKAVAAAIERFEPRLTKVHILLAEGREFDRSVRFVIEGVLNVEPAPELVQFDSVLQLHTRSFEIKAE